jgi:pimeloyl-ACP methyl ester carboxylesterase
MTARRIHLTITLICCGLLTWPLSTRAQNKEKDKTEVVKPEKARFTTVDGVELHGNFFPSSKKKAPVVIMLHALGEDSKKAAWVSLASELQQKAGVNVLTFDFRGHGQSTEVEPEKFWAVPYNRSFAGGKGGALVGKGTIDLKNFDKRYIPALINDIAAARAYLERTKNEDGACSTSSIIVLGAETGGTLGAVWATSEWFRFKLNPPVLAGMEATLDMRPEGKDIIGAIYLSLSPKLADRPVRLDKVLHVPGAKGKIPMLFIYGEKDGPGKNIGLACAKYLKKEENKRAVAYEIEGSKLTGVGLLQKSLPTEQVIVDVANEIIELKSNEWTEREFKKTQYFRAIPGEAPVLIKPAGEINLAFEIYDKFMPDK